MLAPADVLKIKNEFVSKMIRFIQKRKYLMDTCICEVYPYFADMVLATELADCLTYTDECKLTKKADGYEDVEEVIPVASCTDQLTVSASSKLFPCDPVITIGNSVDGSKYPYIFLENDTIYQDAKIDVSLTDCKNSETVTFTCGCTNDVCDDAYKVWGAIGWTLVGAPSMYTNGYVNTFNVYSTDVNGAPVATSTTLDVSPANLVEWTTCPTCDSILDSDLLFSSNNYHDTWITLMNNISKTLYDGEIVWDPVLIQSGTGANTHWLYLFRIKHNPSSYWMGLKKNAFSLSIYTGTANKGLGNIAGFYSNASFLHDSEDITTTCGTTTVHVDSFGAGAPTLNPSSSFNYLSFLTNKVPVPITLSTSGDTDCDSITLIGSYNTTGTISQQSWTNPSNVAISTTNTAVVDSNDTGVYTYYVSLENGCDASTTITI